MIFNMTETSFKNVILSFNSYFGTITKEHISTYNGNALFAAHVGFRALWVLLF